MKLPPATHCPNCQPLAQRLARLEQQLADALGRIARLETENARLREENRRLCEENQRLGEENGRLQRQLAAARKDSSTAELFERLPGEAVLNVDETGHKENGEAYFRFITTPGIDPTNNLAEQAIRFVVIDRHITQGTRSEKGRRWCERIWTVIATCAQSVVDHTTL